MKMKVISLVSVLLLTACAVYGFKESRNSDDEYLQRAVPESYEPVGCYSFKKMMKKLQIFNKKAYKKAKATSGTPFDKCVVEAKENNYEIIGIQKTGKNVIICRKGNEQQWKADIKKMNPNKCKNDVGSRKSIFIYRKNQEPEISNNQCTFEDKIFNEGEEAQMYNKTDNELNAFCRVCKCSHGKFRDCVEFMCEVGFMECEEIIHAPGKCCPICKPSDRKCDGRKLGHTWLEHKNKNCLFCECQAGDKAICKKVKTSCPAVKCKHPVIREGECCPYCEPVTTNPPSFVMKPTEQRSTPNFQFPFRR